MGWFDSTSNDVSAPGKVSGVSQPYVVSVDGESDPKKIDWDKANQVKWVTGDGKVIDMAYKAFNADQRDAVRGMPFGGVGSEIKSDPLFAANGSSQRAPEALAPPAPDTRKFEPASGPSFNAAPSDTPAPSGGGEASPLANGTPPAPVGASSFTMGNAPLAPGAGVLAQPLTAAAGPGGYMVPQTQATTVGVQGGVHLGDDIKNQGIGAAKAQSDAIAAQAKIGADLATQQAAFIDQTQREDDARRAERNLRAYEVQNQVKVREQDRDAAVDDYMKSKVDPNRHWKNMGTGGQVFAALAVALNGFGNGLTGRAGNDALGIIQHAIDRDIEAQKIELGKKKDAVDMANNSVAYFNDKLGSLDRAEQAAQLVHWQRAERMLGQMAKTADGGPNGMIAQRAKEQQALIQGKVAEMRANWAALEADRITTQTQTQSAFAMPGMMDPKNRERYVNGVGLARRPESAEKVSEIWGANEANKAGIDALLGYVGKGASLSPTQRAKANVEIQALVGKLREPIMGPGVLTPAEREILLGIVKDPTKIWSMDEVTAGALGTLRNRLDENTHRTIEPYMDPVGGYTNPYKRKTQAGGLISQFGVRQ